MAPYDIVIVGGGLAGLSAAATIAQGCRATIAIVEGRGLGSNNPTPMTFIDVIEQFGLDDHIIGYYRRFSYHSPLGNKSSHSYTTHPLVALDYQGACRELWRRSQAAGHVDLINRKAVRLQRSADRSGKWHIHTNDGQKIITPLLIDASGRSLFTIRALNLPGPKMFSHCFGQTLVNCTVPDPEEVFFLAPTDRYGDGGGWLYPLSGGRVSFGFATLGVTIDFPGKVVKQRYYRALHQFEPYATWLADAQLDHVEVGTIPICPPSRLVYNGLMLIGDAAGQATIWSCMGSEPALVSGKLAGLAATEAYRWQDYSVNQLQSYQGQWDQMYRRIYRQGALLAPVSWRQGEVSWNRQILVTVQKHTPAQMLAVLRSNWPMLSWWQIAFIRAYDWAGRLRRGLMARLSGRRRKSSETLSPEGHI